MKNTMTQLLNKIAELEAQLKIAELEAQLENICSRADIDKQKAPVPSVGVHTVKYTAAKAVKLAGTEVPTTSVQKTKVPDTLTKLRSMGAAWFVSRAYTQYINAAAKAAYTKAGSQACRESVYKKLRKEDIIEMATLVANMSPERLETNKIGLKANSIIKMAKELARI